MAISLNAEPADPYLDLVDKLQKELESMRRVQISKDKDIGLLKEDIAGYKLRIEELENIIRRNIHDQGFSKAADIPKTLYIRAGDAWGYYKKLHEATRYCTSGPNKDYWRKVVFDSEADGRLIIKGLEGSETDK